MSYYKKDKKNYGTYKKVVYTKELPNWIKSIGFNDGTMYINENGLDRYTKYSKADMLKQFLKQKKN